MFLFKHYRDVPDSLWHWENFAPREIACRGSGEIKIVPEAMDALQRVRRVLGAPMVLTSAYRSRLHNARVGGAPLSAHRALVPGILAFDILIAGHDRNELLQTCLENGFGSYGKYKTFLHVDTRKGRSWGSWN